MDLVNVIVENFKDDLNLLNFLLIIAVGYFALQNKALVKTIVDSSKETVTILTKVEAGFTHIKDLIQQKNGG